jgi:hypothetical protein
MRRLAWGIVVTGLLTGLAGEFLAIIQSELLYRALPLAPNDEALRLAHADLSIWPAVGLGTAVAAVGLLLLGLRASCASLVRLRLFVGLVHSRDELSRR